MTSPLTPTPPNEPRAAEHLERARDLAVAIRRHVVRMAGGPTGAHVGGSLSCAEILASLHATVMTEADAFVLSKGHAAPALYGLLAEQGTLDSAELEEYAQPGSRLFGHPPRGLPGVVFPTGSLGHGLGLSLGLATGNALSRRGGRVFVLLGDGELQEGSVWEAVMYAGHARTPGLVAVVDRNGAQITGTTEDTVTLEPLSDRFTSFGWTARDVDGHDCAALRAALDQSSDRPIAVIARTVKGRGVPFLENRVTSHYATFKPQIVQRALAALFQETQ